MNKVMAVFAHPDDEGMIAGTLAALAQHGSAVILVCATRGEAGEISDPDLASRENLGIVRQAELEKACALIGIKKLHFLDYRDSGMQGTPDNGDPRALIQADENEVIGKLVGLIRRQQPQIVITFEPFGWYGHPDHQVISRWATAAYTLAADSTAFPQSGPAWQAKSLFHAVLAFSKFKSVIEQAIAAGYIAEGPRITEQIPEEQLLNTEAAVTHVIDVNGYFDRKQEAMYAHRTQFAEDHLFRKIPADGFRRISGQEYFIQVAPQPANGRLQEPVNDLFTLI